MESKEETLIKIYELAKNNDLTILEVIGFLSIVKTMKIIQEKKQITLKQLLEKKGYSKEADEDGIIINHYKWISEAVKEWLQQKRQEIENKKNHWIYYRKHGDAMIKIINELLKD